MPTPTDTHDLLRSLEAILATIAKAQKTVNESIEQFRTSGVDTVADKLASAAIAAGMSPGVAGGYAEEYEALLARITKSLAAADESIDDAADKTLAMVHISRVLPHRCPARPTAAGKPVLLLS